MVAGRLPSRNQVSDAFGHSRGESEIDTARHAPFPRQKACQRHVAISRKKVKRSRSARTDSYRLLNHLGHSFRFPSTLAAHKNVQRDNWGTFSPQPSFANCFIDEASAVDWSPPYAVHFRDATIWVSEFLRYRAPALRSQSMVCERLSVRRFGR